MMRSRFRRAATRHDESVPPAVTAFEPCLYRPGATNAKVFASRPPT
jgi:hypothetical protein